MPTTVYTNWNQLTQQTFRWSIDKCMEGGLELSNGWWWKWCLLRRDYNWEMTTDWHTHITLKRSNNNKDNIEHNIQDLICCWHTHTRTHWLMISGFRLDINFLHNVDLLNGTLNCQSRFDDLLLFRDD